MVTFCPIYWLKEVSRLDGALFKKAETHATHYDLSLQKSVLGTRRGQVVSYKIERQEGKVSVHVVLKGSVRWTWR